MSVCTASWLLLGVVIGQLVLPRAQPADSPNERFDAYLVQHGREYQRDSTEYLERRAIFHRRLQEVRNHNARPGRLWTAGINHLSDRDDEELEVLMGYRPGVRARSIPNIGGSAALEVEARNSSAELDAVDWRNLSMAADVYDQGHCGSCWAVATATLLEAHYEIAHGKKRSFSAQELVSCVKNPRHCGGKGGCDGATVELGLKWALESGLLNIEETPYEAGDAPCKKEHLSVFSFNEGEMDADGRIMTSPRWQQELEETAARHVGGGGASFGLIGFSTLTTNKEAPLVRALSEQGPVAIAVAANSWFPYESGIFDSCGSNDWVVNHAVTLFGYGRTGGSDKTPNQKYWLIRNSWGPGWGEKGFIRMIRISDEEKHCGTDSSPQEGVACDGGPSKVTVCGSCGVLYDSVVPHVRASAAPGSRAPAPPSPPQHSDHNTAADPTGDEMRVLQKSTSPNKELRDFVDTSSLGSLAAPARRNRSEPPEIGFEAEVGRFAIDGLAVSAPVVGPEARLLLSDTAEGMGSGPPVEKLLRREAISAHT